MPLQRHTEGTLTVPQASHLDIPMPSIDTGEIVSTLRGASQGSAQSKGAGYNRERVYLGGHVEACRNESLHVPVPHT